ncbi:unnamed protein product [Cyprideis torosa]|uniref:Maspardin n=1 Tax=Cyprideis torosa TaxID=163714 RepID=A0A7R8ZRV8_9CRUS|nr:unnamed protein product [Cyprideis torosa]CAG0894109.1 unnamed protein product [Cyprideis torosa]
MSIISNSPEYKSFRASVPKRTITVDHAPGPWEIYDVGPRSVKCPLVLIPPVSGTGDVFYKQLLTLSARDIRAIAVSWPPYWSSGDWCEGFGKLLDALDLEAVHIFGANLGGFLAQKFAEITSKTKLRVASMILCNTYTDTKVFRDRDASAFFWMLPAFLLRRLILQYFPLTCRDMEIAESIDFMTLMVESLDQQRLASRLTLACVPGFITPRVTIPVTVIASCDESGYTGEIYDEVVKCYPHAKQGFLKTGGHFPNLSRSDEVNLHIAAVYNKDEKVGERRFLYNCNLPFRWGRPLKKSWSHQVKNCRGISLDPFRKPRNLGAIEFEKLDHLIVVLEVAALV